MAQTVAVLGAGALGAAVAARPGATGHDARLQTSTAGPADVGKLADLAAQHHVAYLDAPVSGSTELGTKDTEGSALELAINAWRTASTVVMSDVLRLCDDLDVPHDVLRAGLGAGPPAMPYALQKSELMDGTSFEPGFAVRNALKDLHLAAESHDPSPVLREVTPRLQDTVDAGYGDEDLAAVSRRTS